MEVGYGLGKYAGMEWVGIDAVKKAGSSRQGWRCTCCLGKYEGMEWVGIDAVEKAGSSMQGWRCTMQLHSGAEHFGKVIYRGIITRGCS
jgi:hypothetical protein